MGSRERILAMLHHKEADRVPIQDSPWETTIKRWKKEGMPEDGDPVTYFNYEFRFCGANVCYYRENKTIEEADEYIIQFGMDGQTLKNWKNKTSTPEWIDHTIKTRKDWDEHRHLLEWSDDRIDMKTLEQNRKDYEEGYFVCFSSAIGYDRTQCFTGSEVLLMALALEPDWVEEMFESNAYLVTKVADELLKKGFKFDAAFFFDDLGYRNGLLFSPQMYKKLLKPYHKKITDFFHERNMPTILHSCGNVTEAVPELIDAGFDCLQPLEVKAGMDLLGLKKKYGDRLAFMGGIDVRAMKEKPSVIEGEIKTKIPEAKKGGGYIYHSDHSVPDDISFEQYCRVLELVKKYGSYS